MFREHINIRSHFLSLEVSNHYLETGRKKRGERHYASQVPFGFQTSAAGKQQVKILTETAVIAYLFYWLKCRQFQMHSLRATNVWVTEQSEVKHTLSCSGTKQEATPDTCTTCKLHKQNFCNTLPHSTKWLTILQIGRDHDFSTWLLIFKLTTLPTSYSSNGKG